MLPGESNLEVRTCLPPRGNANGGKPPLLFVHGGYCDAWCWAPYFLPWFAAKGYAAHALSLRGHGASAGRETVFVAGLDLPYQHEQCTVTVTAPNSQPHVTEMSTEEWHRVLRVNLDGAFYTFRAAARHMVERGGGGALVGTASLAAIEGAPRSEHYAATKGAMISMIRALAVEFARYGVRANAILPGWIETDMTANAIGNAKFAGNVLPRIPMRRWGTKEDFAGIAVYLMSDASGYHTGDSFVIDGAYTIF